MDNDGVMWASEPITAISWKDAEEQALIKGVTIFGRLHREEITHEDGTTEIIDYDIIENN